MSFSEFRDLDILIVSQIDMVYAFSYGVTLFLVNIACFMMNQLYIFWFCLVISYIYNFVDFCTLFEHNGILILAAGLSESCV